MNSVEKVENAINTLNKDFNDFPDDFFNEHDLHHKFFYILYPQFKNLLHPEYPTRQRFVKKKGNFESYVKGVHCYGPDQTNKGSRGHYDFIIFKENHYNKHKNDAKRFNILSNKNVNTNLAITNKYIDFAFEFKYITSGSKTVIGEVEFDIFKLKNAKEVEKKYLIIFIRKESMSKKGFKQIIEPLTEFAESEKDIQIFII